MGANSISLSDIAQRLRTHGSYADSCSYEVLISSLPDPVNYNIVLAQIPVNGGDTMAQCNYVVDWALDTPTGITRGFSAYADAAHYRYRDGRMQEYHADRDITPFAPAGHVDAGVQNMAQFIDLLPAYLAKHFDDMVADSTYRFIVKADTLVSGRRSVVVDGVRRISGYDAVEYTYVLDDQTYLPRRIELENNPGQLGEQSIIVKYALSNDNVPSEINEASLVEKYPDAFGRYRSDAYAIENLPGNPLPRIVAPTTTGERYLHERGDSFASPTLVAFVDAGVETTPRLVAAVRAAVDYLPFNLDVVWAFVDHRTDDIEAVIPSIRPGETLLMNARAASTACGVGTDTPVLLFVAPDGIVKDFERGYNPDIKSIVIQKASITI